jgi:hypothetical protein
VNDLVVNSELLSTIVNDEDTNAATSIVERLGKAAEQIALVNDWETLLDITRLGHGDDTAVITDVEDTVLLEDWAQHVLDNDGWGWSGDEGWLLMKLLGEQINTEVTVLASLWGGGDADDLARTSLKHQEITDADVVAWDSDGSGGRHLVFWCVCWSDVSAGEVLGGRGVSGGWSGGVAAVNVGVARSRDLDFAVFDDDFLTLDFWVLVVVVMTDQGWSVNWMSDTFCNTLNTTTEWMILSLVVVIAHVPLGWVNGSPSSFLYSGVFLWVTRSVDSGTRGAFDVNFGCLDREVLCWTPEAGAFLVEVLGGLLLTVAVLCYDKGGSTLTELAFSSVESGFECRCWTTDGTAFTVVRTVFGGEGLVLNVDLGVDVSRERFLITEDGC